MNGRFNNDTSLHTPERQRANTVIILAVLYRLSICCNSLVIYCLVSNRKKTWARKAKQLFYLVLSDLLAGIFQIPRIIFMILNIIHYTVKTYAVCAGLNYIVIIPQLVSWYHVMLLCVHRYIQIRRVQLPSQVDKYRYGLESCLIWIATVLACAPPIVFWGRHDEVLISCRFMLLFAATDRPAIIYMLVVVGLPWILTNVTYVAMVIKLISTGRVKPIPVLQSGSISQKTTENVASTKQEQPCAHQNTPTPLSAANDHPGDNKHVHQDTETQFSAPVIQLCNIGQQSTSQPSVGAAGSTTLEEPHTHKRSTTRHSATIYHYQNSKYLDAPENRFVSSAQQPYYHERAETTFNHSLTSAQHPYNRGHDESANVSLLTAQQPYNRGHEVTKNKSLATAQQPYNSGREVIAMESLTIAQQPFNHGHEETTDHSQQPYNRGVQHSIFVRERNKTVVKAIAVLLLAFNVSNLPLIIIPYMMLFGKNDDIPIQLQALVFLNNVLNPIIYTFAFNQLREEVKRLLRLAFSRLRNNTTD